MANRRNIFFIVILYKADAAFFPPRKIRQKRFPCTVCYPNHSLVGKISHVPNGDCGYTFDMAVSQPSQVLRQPVIAGSAQHSFGGSNRGTFGRLDWPAETVAYRTNSSTRSAIADRDQARQLRQLFPAEPHRLEPGWGRSRPEPREVTGSRLSPRIYAVPTSDSPDSPFARAVVDWFADQVARQFTGQLLLGTQRKALLKTADRLGIDRFHANLIIAVAQHESTAKSGTHTRLNPKARRFSLLTATVLVAVQTLIAWGAWHLLHGI
jgi:hypothetical protein